MAQLQRKMQDWQKDFPDDLDKALNKVSKEVVAEAQRNYLTGPRPQKLGVVTGRLRSSITNRVKKEHGKVIAQVGTNVTYGRLWELGEGNRKARPFLRPAVQAKRPRILEVLEDAMIKSYKRA